MRNVTNFLKPHNVTRLSFRLGSRSQQNFVFVSSRVVRDFFQYSRLKIYFSWNFYISTWSLVPQHVLSTIWKFTMEIRQNFSVAHARVGVTRRQSCFRKLQKSQLPFTPIPRTQQVAPPGGRKSLIRKSSPKFSTVILTRVSVAC